MFFLLLLALIVILLVFSKTNTRKKPSAYNKARQRSADSAVTELNNTGTTFLPPIPKGYQIYTYAQVAGVTFRKNDALEFIGGSDQVLELEREIDNKYDKNAIKIIGVTARARKFIGYMPKDVSRQVVAADMFNRIKPRLEKVYVGAGSDPYIEINFQLIGLKTEKPQFDAFFRG